ncbi:MAG: patatin-like phospholipase family protein, partial [Rhizobiales bacterium]|nr:patatin-like phospholipase family protein [Hyphomicrobiales bacterium]
MGAAPDGLRIGVALGGGAAQGFGHVVVLEALDELGLRPAAMAGTSMGAIVGAAYAAGMRGAEIRAYAASLFRGRGAALAALWRLRPRRVGEISLGIGQYDLVRALGMLLPPGLPERIEDLGLPFAVVATDFYGGGEVVLRSGPLIPALAASSAVPMLFRPVRLGGRVMIDGGCVNPVPYDRLGDVDLAIASDVVSLPRGDPSTIPGALKAAGGSVVLVLKALLREKLRTAQPDLMIKPPTGVFGPMDFHKAEAVIAACDRGKDAIKR